MLERKNHFGSLPLAEVLSLIDEIADPIVVRLAIKKANEQFGLNIDPDKVTVLH